MLKKWLFACTVLLVGCQDEPVSPIIEEVTQPNSDVQSVIDLTTDEKYASLIYSEQDDSYLLLNTATEVTVSAENVDNSLHLSITEGEKLAAIEDHVFRLELAEAYDKIHVYVNGNEISFEVWYDQAQP